MIADCGKNSIVQYNIAQHAIKISGALHKVIWEFICVLQVCETAYICVCLHVCVLEIHIIICTSYHWYKSKKVSKALTYCKHTFIEIGFG